MTLAMAGLATPACAGPSCDQSAVEETLDVLPSLDSRRHTEVVKVALADACHVDELAMAASSDQRATLVFAAMRNNPSLWREACPAGASALDAVRDKDGEARAAVLMRACSLSDRGLSVADVQGWSSEEQLERVLAIGVAQRLPKPTRERVLRVLRAPTPSASLGIEDLHVKLTSYDSLMRIDLGFNLREFGFGLEGIEPRVRLICEHGGTLWFSAFDSWGPKLSSGGVYAREGYGYTPAPNTPPDYRPGPPTRCQFDLQRSRGSYDDTVLASACWTPQGVTYAPCPFEPPSPPRHTSMKVISNTAPFRGSLNSWFEVSTSTRGFERAMATSTVTCGGVTHPPSMEQLQLRPGSHSLVRQTSRVDGERDSWDGCAVRVRVADEDDHPLAAYEGCVMEARLVDAPCP